VDKLCEPVKHTVDNVPEPPTLPRSEGCMFATPPKIPARLGFVVPFSLEPNDSRSVRGRISFVKHCTECSLGRLISRLFTVNRGLNQSRKPHKPAQRPLGVGGVFDRRTLDIGACLLGSGSTAGVLRIACE